MSDARDPLKLILGGRADESKSESDRVVDAEFSESDRARAEELGAFFGSALASLFRALLTPQPPPFAPSELRKRAQANTRKVLRAAKRRRRR